MRWLAIAALMGILPGLSRVVVKWAARLYFFFHAQTASPIGASTPNNAATIHQWLNPVDNSGLHVSWTIRMDDPIELVGAMFVIALCAVVLVGGQLYLSNQIKPNAGTSDSRPSLAENAAPVR